MSQENLQLTQKIVPTIHKWMTERLNYKKQQNNLCINSNSTKIYLIVSETLVSEHNYTIIGVNINSYANSRYQNTHSLALFFPPYLPVSATFRDYFVLSDLSGKLSESAL